MAKGREYSVGLRGESNYQFEITVACVGDRVTLEHDDTNRYDDRAIVALNAGRRPIGYLPRDGWLTEVILDQGIDVRATIRSIDEAPGGDFGVVLAVTW